VKNTNNGSIVREKHQQWLKMKEKTEKLLLEYQNVEKLVI